MKDSMKDFYKYHLKRGIKIVYRGITDNLERAELEHQAMFPDSHVQQIGVRTTYEHARLWERRRRQKAT